MSGLLRFVVTLQQQANDFSSQGAEHHASSSGPAEVVLVVIGVIITAVVTFYTIKWLFWPGERGADHIKRRILHDEN